MKHLLRRILEDLGKLTSSEPYPSVAASSLNKEAYDKGWRNYDQHIKANPYAPGSIEHFSWKIGQKDADRHDRSIW
ncbi:MULTISPECIES: hypothetical protein [Burkholderia cepacia complex]|uniref:hypothetical protein n=1 Tax=Burkholderia cepacia complex TaxID=87882 RepID=UPI001593699B|nr:MULTISPECIES: hypothetical protein [Burkholderia cepacia complex]MBR8188303.1 hypothetical protein [Burkholderia vietnamiensis]